MKTAYKISQVSVYPDRARVTCVGAVDLTEDTSQIVFDDLPLTLEPDSVRVGGAGAARVRLMGVELTRHFYEQTPAERVQALEREIEQVEDEKRALEDDQAGWLAHMAHLSGLRDATAEFARGLSRGRLTIEEQMRMAINLRDQDHEVRAALRALDEQKRVLDRRLEKLRRDLGTLQSARPRQRYRAVVDVTVLQGGAFTPTLTYVVRNAGWRPLYDVRLAEGENGRFLAIDTLAQIEQNTGQDWEQAALSVSTARPALNQRLPELKPWYIDEVKARPVPQPRSKKMQVGPTLMADMPQPEAAMAAAAPVEARAEVAVAEVVDSGTAVTFAIAGKIDIPSDGSPHKTTLSQHKFDPQIDYLAIPKHTDAVYRRAKIMNASDTPYLPGQANLFVNDAYIGRTQMEYTPTSGEIELLLGVEERITIERELVKRDVDKRFLRDERQLRYGYRIKIKNLLAEAAKMQVEDQIPVSRHEQIKVKMEDVQPEPVERSDLNELKWRMALEPGVEKIIQYEFSVQHPRDMQVHGLFV